MPATQQGPVAQRKYTNGEAILTLLVNVSISDFVENYAFAVPVTRRLSSFVEHVGPAATPRGAEVPPGAKSFRNRTRL